IRRMDMHRRDIARIVDRDRAADRRRYLQAAAETGIGEEELLPVGEFDRRHVRFLRDLRDAIEIGRDLFPAPAMRLRLHLIGADTTGRELAADIETSLAEPRPL